MGLKFGDMLNLWLYSISRDSVIPSFDRRKWQYQVWLWAYIRDEDSR